MPPVLDPERSRVDGLAFLGLSLARRSPAGHPDSVSHQVAFDLNDVNDRPYDYLQRTDDDGWRGGGGEPGPPASGKLPARDSSHVEVMRVGTFERGLGGVSEAELLEVLKSGKILIPQIEVLPVAVVASSNSPPELELRFDMPYGPDFDDLSSALPPNWQLRFIHNQLFKHFQHPSRFCPRPFHATLAGQAEFRSKSHEDAYFSMCEAVVKKWRLGGPRALNAHPAENKSGLWLFTDRQNPTHFFLPNFLPPYDDREKRQIILSYLAEEWDETKLEWKRAEYPERAKEAPAAKEVVPAPAAGGFWCSNPIEALLGGGGAKPADVKA